MSIKKTGSTVPEEEKQQGTAGFALGAYKPSEAVTKAQDMIQQQLSQKPGAYKSQWQAQLDDTMKKILNREKFSYDLNGDALYHQYKDMAVQQGRQAMMDTMGQAQAMTGGYGNSYAQGVGQQAYQGHLQQLNNVIPELYQMAYDKYAQEGNDLMNQFGLLADREVQDYGRHQDSMDRWSEELARLQNRYDSERSFDYGQWADGRDFGYGQFRDETADKQWQAEFDEAIRRYNFEHGITGQEETPANKGTPGTGIPPVPQTGLSEEEIKEIQKSLGLPADGIWGPETQATVKAMWGVDSAEAAKEAYGKTSGQGTTNKSGNGWIAIGNSRYTYDELLKMVDQGKVKETYDPKTGKYSYTRVS